ncbi:hypothetical protein [Bradyrhizobium sp. cf659]|uniref:hypothetical protein n=1 Tax=Bradyrhizobium sp. cf659 TaxID=1761771 RepID=UPI001160793B|nr:hypothetical protein [Bradyrhizobium sp. cf659]
MPETVVARAGAAAGVIVLVFLAIFLLLTAMRRRIVEFDLVTRKLTMSHSRFRRPNKVFLDCPFDQCRALGRIEYETDGHASYGVYVELLSGRRHDIPVKGKTVQEAGRVAARLSEATGIPRLDTKF